MITGIDSALKIIIFTKILAMINPIIETYTIEQYQILSAAIASGAVKVHYGDKTVDYRTLDEMLRIQGIMISQLFPCSKSNNGRKFASFSKGTECGRRRNRY